MLRRAAALIYFSQKRRTVERNDGGWYASTINKYVTCGDEQTYRKNFRVTKATLLDISERLKSAGYVMDNDRKCTPLAKRQTSLFKVAVCMYYLAAGGEAGGRCARTEALAVGARLLRRRQLVAVRREPALLLRVPRLERRLPLRPPVALRQLACVDSRVVRVGDLVPQSPSILN